MGESKCEHAPEPLYRVIYKGPADPPPSKPMTLPEAEERVRVGRQWWGRAWTSSYPDRIERVDPS